jgi:metallo-beta-lactamase family protein
MSGHADQNELLEWVEPLVPTLKKVFLVHGEPEQSAALAKLLASRYSLDVAIARTGESHPLE